MDKSRCLAYSVERRAYSKTSLSAKRYPCLAGSPHGEAVGRQALNAKAFCILIIAFWSLHFNAYAQPASSTELINNAKLYDGKTVVYGGEVIGDIMARGRYAWVNLNDGQNAVGIWMPGAMTKDIRLTGSYKSKGDWIEVTGIFHRACAEHGGDLDIHAQAIRKIQSGKTIIERANPAKRNLFITLAGILCLIILLRQFKRA